VGKVELPSFGRSTVRLLCMHSAACASERNWSAWGLMYSKIRSRLTLERARKLIYVRCNSRQCSKSAEVDRSGTWQAACSSLRRTTRRQRKQNVEFQTEHQGVVETLGGWAGRVADQLFGFHQTQSGLQEGRSN